MIIKRLSFVLLVLGLSSVCAQAQKLESGKPIERDLTRGESHIYQLKLAAGQFLRVVVEQKGIDVALTLVSPDGKQLLDSDVTDALGSREPLSFEAKAAGDYKLVVRANGVATLSGAYQQQTELKVSAEARLIGEYRMRSSSATIPGGTYQVLLELKASASEQDRRRVAADQLLIEAAVLSRQMEFQQSIEKQQQALMLWRELGDRSWESDVLRSIGRNNEDLSGYDKAGEYYEQVLAIRRALNDRRGEAGSLSDLGLVYDRMSSYDKALEYFQQALAINQELKNRREEGVSLCWIGWVNYRLKQNEKATDYSERALTIAREVKNRGDEAEAVNNLATVYRHLGQPEKAREYGEQYLAIKREFKSKVGEAAALHNQQLYYRMLFRFEKGIECLEQALAIYHELKARKKEAQVLRNLGDTYMQITRLDKVVEYYEQAVPIYREINDRQGEAFVLGPLADAYNVLGRPEKSIEYFDRALSISRELKTRPREAGFLNGLGNANQTLGRYEKALEFYEQSLAISRELKLFPGFQAMLLGNIGETYQLQGRNDKAVEYLQQGLTLAREAKIRLNHNETYQLIVLGDVFRAQAQYTQAILNHEQALRFSREMKNRALEGRSLHRLMLDWRAQNRPGLAVFFGKQAVNLYQEIRSEITGLERESQQSFVKSKEDTYRTLADLLISQGRLPEAEQVIDMLKEEEYFDFIRRDEGNSSKAQKAALTPEEQALEKRYREIADQLASLGAERGTLMDKTSRTPEEEQRLARLDADLVVAGNAFQKFLDQLTTELGSSA